MHVIMHSGILTLKIGYGYYNFCLDSGRTSKDKKGT